MTSSNNSPEQPFANDAGIEVPAVTVDDPYRALDELMVVVEALCPVWPEREHFVETKGKMLL